jgi:hypothetical protein
MAARSEAGPSLPAHRSFVVQLQADADPAAGRFLGRVEHVTSGQATRFSGVEELVAFVSRLLRDERDHT